MATNAEVAHIWAQREGKTAKTSNGTFSCRDNCLYSYDTMIARFYGDVVVYSTHAYSKTTVGRHYSAMHRAITHIREKYAYDGHVQYLPYSWPHVASILIDELVKQYETGLNKLSRKRTHINAAIFTLQILYSKVDALCIRCNYKNELGVYPTKEYLCEKFPTLAKRITDQENEIKEREHLNSLSLEEKIVEWKSGKNVYIPSGLMDILLRVKGKYVETSKGVKIPVDEAKALFPAIASRSLPKGFRIAQHYRFDNFTDTALVAGCHTIPFTEINEVAAKLGL